MLEYLFPAIYIVIGVFFGFNHETAKCVGFILAGIISSAITYYQNKTGKRFDIFSKIRNWRRKG